MTTFFTGVCNSACVIYIIPSSGFSLAFVNYYEIFLGKGYCKSPDYVCFNKDNYHDSCVSSQYIRIS